MQSSIQQRVIDCVRFCYQESWLYQLHEEIDRRIGVELIPEHLRVPQILSDWSNKGITTVRTFRIRA